ncbi:MAG TPA: DUF5672 family protein [Moheibacter sp.]|nr:DUF5672 family protein [Moheibacter sp.]
MIKILRSISIELMREIKIIVPIYKSNLKEFELLSIKRSLKVLHRYTFSIVCPQGLDIQEIELLFKDHDHEVVRMSPDYFKSVESYNRLMLSEEFYQQYLDTKYILICQTDVYVFRDELEFWCNLSYDYLGAPWIGTPQIGFYKLLIDLGNQFKVVLGKRQKKYNHLFKVGNGGFSLRKVYKHYEIVVKNKALIEYYLNHKEKENFHIEDVFFSLKAPELDASFSIPNWQEALGFCIDRKPKLALKYSKGKLPFAIHGFNKPKVKVFWAPIIAQQND